MTKTREKTLVVGFTRIGRKRNERFLPIPFSIRRATGCTVGRGRGGRASEAREAGRDGSQVSHDEAKIVRRRNEERGGNVGRWSAARASGAGPGASCAAAQAGIGLRRVRDARSGRPQRHGHRGCPAKSIDLRAGYDDDDDSYLPC